jgi:hypothetical protein
MGTTALLRSRAVEGRRIARLLISQPVSVTTVGTAIRRKTNWEWGEPWWNSRAIRYLGEHAQPGDSVFEWGCGGSTVWLARRGFNVTSVEHDPEWAAKVADRCPEADVRLIPGMSQGHLRSEPELRDRGQHFFDRYVAEIDQIEDQTVDVVLVDGLCRLECIRRGSRKVKPGGMLIVDDTDFRFLSVAAKQLPGWRAVRLTGFKRPLDVRETTFFHKRG